MLEVSFLLQAPLLTKIESIIIVLTLWMDVRAVEGGGLENR